MSDTMQIFDRAAKRRQRARAAGRAGEFDFLRRPVAAALVERLDDIRRDFGTVLVLGATAAWLRPLLGARGAGMTLVGMDALPPGIKVDTRDAHVVGDEELLPFAAGRFDLVLAPLGLHWINDLPGALVQIRHALKPDGLFLGAMLGGATLTELRQSWLLAEAELEGGAGPRISPMAETLDGAALLQRAGFALPVADSDRLTVTYADALRLMADLRGMGETNALLARRRSFTRRGTLLRMAALYAERFGGPDGRIPATFEVISLTGWAPHASQQQPLRPGAAKHRLADALGTVEIPAGEKAGPGR